MRSLPFDTTKNLALPILVTITTGIVSLRFTSHNQPVVSGGNTFHPVPGCDVTNLQFPGDGTPATADVTVMAVSGGLIQPGDGTRGALDGWPITIEMFDLGNLVAGTYDLIPKATIGTVQETTRGLITISVNGPLNRAKGPLTEHYSLTGREELGDDRCKIPILPADIGRSVAFVRPDIATGLLAVNDAYGRFKTGSMGDVTDYANVYYECTTAGTTASSAPTYDPTVGNSTTDGTAVFIARNAWLRYAHGQRTGDFTIQLTALPDTRATDDTWYVLGGIYVRSGPLDGYPVIPIRSWDHATLTVTTFLPIGANDMPANTQLEIHTGCNLTPDQCFSRFNNITNLRAETFVPPSNTIGIF
jgi:hypothetical protein